MVKQLDIDDVVVGGHLMSRRDDGHLRVQTVFTKPSKVKSEFKDQCDINKIVARHRSDVNALLSQSVEIVLGKCKDLLTVDQYYEASCFAKELEQTFYNLPAKLRDEHDNDPYKFLRFASDERNAAHLKEYGVVLRKAGDVSPSRPAGEPGEAATPASSEPKS